MNIFHLTTKPQWEEAKNRSLYLADSLATEGFIHCSTKAQITAVANTFYKGLPNITLLEISPSSLISPLKFEAPVPQTNAYPEETLFPHIYGPLNLDAVVKVYDLQWMGQEFEIPKSVLE